MISNPTSDPIVPDFGVVDPLLHILDQAPLPFVATKGSAHALVYANRSFYRVVDTLDDLVGRPIQEILLPEGNARLRFALDRALSTGVPIQDHFLGRVGNGAASWSCSIWPRLQSGGFYNGLALQLRMLTDAERTIVLQREVTERLLLSALRESEVADVAGASHDRTKFLVEAGRRLGQSLDERTTRDIVAGIALPALGSWCIVDVIEPSGEVTRLAMIHPDPRKQEILNMLAKDWAPQSGDPFGAPAVLRSAKPVVSKFDAADLGLALAPLSRTPENLLLLAELGVGPLLTVPLVSHARILGAVTFVSGQPGRAYSRDDVELAEGLAARSAEALNSARLYGEAIALREQADASSRSRMRFMGNISHELRTPLNAILGYSQLMESEIHGPITPAQRHDLERIRVAQEHLLVLVTDILGFVRAGLVPVTACVTVSIQVAIAQVLSILDILATQKGVVCRSEVDDADAMIETDPDRLQQVLINLISNAIKFTPPGGTVTTRCVTTERTVEISVTDTGIGIAADQLEAIFEPFVQVQKGGGATGSVGLGLAISRDLARTMHGELAVVSAPCEGSCFTLTLPRRFV